MSTINSSNFRIHPTIGIARVGNSPDYYLGPETIASETIEGQVLKGGLPIKKGTDDTPISSADLRDADGKLKKQAARFKLYYYSNPSGGYPETSSQEVKLGDTIDDKKVVDIIWSVHLANKKANCWRIGDGRGEGIELYEDGQLPTMRNAEFLSTSDPASENRLKQLVIDAGPRAISAKAGGIINFDEATTASYYSTDSKKIESLNNYPKQFPFSDGSSNDYNDFSQPIKDLGAIQVETNGRLVVTGGQGLACGFTKEGKINSNAEMPHDVDNDNWLDDAADGPVNATIVFNDGTHLTLENTAWVAITDPAYAPQTLNAVSLWDNVYTTWVEDFALIPDLYDASKVKTGQKQTTANEAGYNPNYKPSFYDDVKLTFDAAHMQMWNTALPNKAIASHKFVLRLGSQPNGFDIMSYIRSPYTNDNDFEKGTPLMPLALGDSGRSFLTVTTTQYFMLKQWNSGKCTTDRTPLTAGEKLDKAILMNCLGGRFSPGIDLTFIVTDAHLYNPNWTNPAIGPFRINAKKLDYTTATPDKPFLGVGYTPLRPDKVEPGDICKFMAIPWHADYNSCATHLPAPNPGSPSGELLTNRITAGDNTTLYWSWPAQRPVSVYTYEDLKHSGKKFYNSKGYPQIPQRFSVRGEDTKVQNSDFQNNVPNQPYRNAMMEVGRFQNRKNMLTNWHRIGTIIQSAAIDGYEGDEKDIYLEVQSQFDEDKSNLVNHWPTYATEPVADPLPSPKED